MSRSGNRSRWIIAAMLFVSVPAYANSDCNNSDGLSLWAERCNLKSVGLSALFTRQNTVRGEAAFPTDPPPATTDGQFMAIPSPSQRALIRFPHDAGEPGKPNTLVFRSINKRLSEFGTREPAELLVKCNGNAVDVVLNFPGYPMTSDRMSRKISYQIDDGELWTANFSAAEDFFKIGIWESRMARMFLSSITGGNSLHVTTSDIEQTQITASFDISELPSRLKKLGKACSFAN